MKKGLILGLALPVAAAVAGGLWLWAAHRPIPERTPGDPVRGEWAFWSSDLGSGAYGSIPRAVFDALPELVPDRFPEGWEGLGLIRDNAYPESPFVGVVPTRAFGVEMYSTNCAICHAGVFQGRTVAGAPSFNLDIARMGRSIYAALLDERLTAASVFQLAARHGRPLSAYQKLGIRAWLFQARRWAASAAAAESASAGPGRSDAVNGWKRRLGLESSGAVSFVDLPPIYNQQLKSRTLFDGSVTGDEAARIMLTEVRKGRPPRDCLVHRAVFDDIIAYLRTRLRPPPYPFPIDQGLAVRGHQVFKDTCSRCHGTYPPDAPSYPNLRVWAGKVKTDDERARAMAGMEVAIRGSLFRDYLRVEPDETYMPPPLNGVWLSAPYLHNGSVPTLWHLLHAESDRPVTFYRPWNAFDPERVGLLCPESRAGGVLACGMDAQQQKHDPGVVARFDTRERGNSNAGHPFGRDLPESEKRAVIEYLKTL